MHSVSHRCYTRASAPHRARARMRPCSSWNSRACVPLEKLNATELAGSFFFVLFLSSFHLLSVEPHTLYLLPLIYSVLLHIILSPAWFTFRRGHLAPLVNFSVFYAVDIKFSTPSESFLSVFHDFSNHSRNIYGTLLRRRRGFLIPTQTPRWVHVLLFPSPLLAETSLQ